MAANPIKSGQLNLVYVGPDEYYTDAENIWEWSKGITDFRLVVYAGLNTDIASVPGLLGLAKTLGFEKDGPQRRAAVGHDFLYLIIKKYGGLVPSELGRYEIRIKGQWTRATSVWSRKDADEFFLHFMLLDGVTPWKAKVMYRAVRLFGGLNMKLT